MPEFSSHSKTEALRKQVEVRAYALWESEGRPHGRDIEHWRQAEAELIAANGSSLRAPSSVQRTDQPSTMKRRVRKDSPAG